MTAKLPDGLATYFKYLPDFYLHFSDLNHLKLLNHLWDLEVPDFPIDNLTSPEEFCAHFLRDAGARCSLMRLILKMPQLRPANIPKDAIEVLSTNSDFPLLEKKQPALSMEDQAVNFWRIKTKEITDFYMMGQRLTNFKSHWNSYVINSEDMPSFGESWKAAPQFHEWISLSKTRVLQALSLFWYYEGLNPFGSVAQITPFLTPTPLVRQSNLTVRVASTVVNTVTPVNPVSFKPISRTVVVSQSDPFLRQASNFLQIFDKHGVLDHFSAVWRSYGFTPELPYFGIGREGAHNWFDHFQGYPTQRNELIYILQHHPEFRPAEVKVDELPNWARPQCPYDLPKNMRN